jgi:carbamoyltransferase
MKHNYILGISAFYHDSAAALIKDGFVIAAAQEERFTRKKHDSGFPENAIRYCLEAAGIGIGGLDFVVFYEKPLVKFERILETALNYSPFSLAQFMQAVPLWLKQKLWVKDAIINNLGYKGEVLFTGHHEAHAASAFFPSPFERAAFLTMDGVGEWDTASFGIGCGNNLAIEYSLDFPHSLGLLYSAFTYFTGFRVNSGEYKLMGLAPYGKPVYRDLILKELVEIKDDGSLKLNMKYFGFCTGLRMTNRRFGRLFGCRPRKPETKIRQIDMDIASSIQEVTEEAMLKMARHVHKVTGEENLCLAGGVALNCVGNGRIMREGPFKNIWIQPASGDAGGALGAAMAIWHMYLGNKREAQPGDSMHGSLLGPQYDDSYIETFLNREKIPYSKLSGEEIPAVVADLIDKQYVIGWFQGRMEFGPRALGSRSIIGDARSQEMQSRMNLKIKFRESFRPFAPSVMEDKAAEWFELNGISPYMLITTGVQKDKRVKDQGGVQDEGGLGRLKLKRSLIPSVTHVNYSARVQTVNRSTNPLYYDTIEAFYKGTGCPVIINTSFNVRGEPIVMSPEDAFRCFIRTGMDYLLVGSYLLDKSKQKVSKESIVPLKYQELD